MYKIVTMKPFIITLMFSLSSLFASAQSSNVTDFEAKLLATKKPQLLDVRTAKEYAEGHLKGAVNIDVTGNNFAGEIKSLSKTEPVFVYCRSGRRSKTAVSILKEAGIKTVYDLDGGIISWEKAGKPVEK